MNLRRIAISFLLLLAYASVPAIAQDDAELIDMVVGLLAESDKDIRAIALDQIRTKAPGAEATKQFAAQLSKVSDDAKVGLLSALADRGDVAAKSAVADVLNASKSDELQVAAIRALSKLGDGSNVSDFVKRMDSKATSEAARTGLIQLQGDGITKSIVSELSKSPIAMQEKLIAILTARRALDGIPDLLKMAQGDDAKLRAAAMKSLGKLASPEHVPELVKGVLKAKVGGERNNAEKNLMFVCNGISDKEKRADPLLAAMDKLNSSDRTAMLQCLGRVGGPAALKEVDKALASRDRTIHMAGIRAISNWPDATVADRLIKLAKTGRHPDHKRIARMSLLRIAPLPDGRTDAEKLELLKTSMKLAANDKEKNYGIKRAAAIRLVETLRYVLPYIDQSAFSKEACQTVVELSHDRKLRDDNKPEFHAAMDKVIATTKDPVLIERCNRYKTGQTWERPK
ncbi:MAG: hypothetical protein AAF497_07305 [Planctomycetota bacterium]